MASKIKVDNIEENTSSGGVNFGHNLNLKSYTTSQINALSGMSAGAMVYALTLLASAAGLPWPVRAPGGKQAWLC